MEQDETVTLSFKSLQTKIGALYRLAESQKKHENRIYALWEAIVDLITRLFEPANKSGTLFSYPQALLGGAQDSAFRRAIPDSGLYFTWMEGNRDSVSPILFCEIKCLQFPDDWHTINKAVRAVALVEAHLSQISLQAFCGFHEFPEAKNIRVILLIGIYFTLFEFERPTPLEKFPRVIILAPSLYHLPSQQHRQNAGVKLIIELMPNPPQCLFFFENLFSNANKEGIGLVFSDAFNIAIRSCFGKRRLRSCELMPYRNVEDHDFAPEEITRLMITDWYDSFSAADSQTPKTPLRGPLGSMIETPTSTGTDYQETSDSDYSEDSSDSDSSTSDSHTELPRKRRRSIDWKVDEDPFI